MKTKFYFFLAGVLDRIQYRTKILSIRFNYYSQMCDIYRKRLEIQGIMVSDASEEDKLKALETLK